MEFLLSVAIVRIPCIELCVMVLLGMQLNQACMIFFERDAGTEKWTFLIYFGSYENVLLAHLWQILALLAHLR